MKSREFKKIYHPSVGRYVYVHRGNGLIVDNIMKPLKGALSAVGNKVGSTVAKAIGRKVTKKAKSAAKSTVEKSGDLIRKRLSGETVRKAPKTTKASKATKAKMSRHEVNTLINNLIAQAQKIIFIKIYNTYREMKKSDFYLKAILELQQMLQSNKKWL